MAEQLTPQQKQAVTDRGGTLLVSAAAGSGKTKVLVDRLMGYLTDPVSPANMDDFLMITYTKAAAAELRGKIAAKLSERISQDPSNRHLRRQLQRLYLTQISTVHSFCSVILKEYAYLLDIPGDFRVADENECLELRQRIMEKVLEKAYDEEGDNPDFLSFVDSQGLGRDDRQVPDIVLKVYDSARCHLQPEKWLDSCLQAAQADGLTDASQTDYGRFLLERLHTWLDAQIVAMERCASLAEAEMELVKSAIVLRSTVTQLRDLRNCDTWDGVYAHRQVDFGTLRFPKSHADSELAEQIKAVREACKKSLAKQIKYFAAPSEQVLSDLNASAPAVRGMLYLVEKFTKEYAQAKRTRKVLDFSDLEHKTLDLLLGKQRTGITRAAREIGCRFQEILVDEYQDSNGVQDAIYSALTQEKHNLFLVGDVKQSIYQFRLADPGIFLEKYNAFAPVEEAVAGQGRKVLLSQNFRSGGAVLSCVNDVFRYCMSEAVGGLTYGDGEALYEGIPREPLPEPETELCCLEVREDTYPEEASYVASRIREMLQKGSLVRGKEGLRPVQPEDIVILLRSPGSSGIYYQRALENLGIRCASGGGEDLLQTQEISTLVSLLQVIQNPLQDIPLVAVLSAPVFGFTADDLARVRTQDRKGSFYEALCRDTAEQSRGALEILSQLRQASRLLGLTELLERIFTTTHLDSIYGAMDNGELRRENLQTVFQLASEQENSGTGSLGRFLEHLQTISQRGLIASGQQTASGCVTVMSIHKSKGLEFPVVFLCGLSRDFNTESQRATILCHKDMGLGLNAVDHERRLRYPTLAKHAIAAQIGGESLSEEMRVLYVAMTRPKDRLIITYASNNLEKELRQMVLRLSIGCKDLLIREAVCPGEWVLLTALNRMESGALFALAGSTGIAKVSERPWCVRVVQAPEHSETAASVVETAEETKDLVPWMEKTLSFQYPHMTAVDTPSKQTATQRKGREKDEEAAENTRQKRFDRTWRRAAFEAKLHSGTDYGVAMHNVMAYLRYENCENLSDIRKELDRLVEEGYIRKQQRELVACKKIAAFFATPIGKKLRTHGDVLREFKFSVLEDGSSIDPSLTGEQVLLQGVVDCAMIDGDGIILMDFKTDSVTPQTLPSVAESYRDQVEAYAGALERIYEKKVKQKLLYFFKLAAFVEL